MALHAGTGRGPGHLNRLSQGSGPSSVAINFGAKTRLGMGGYPTIEAASSALTGTNHGDFKIDDIGTLVPASGGAGTYGNAWTQTGGATSYTLTGASGTIYNITIVTGIIHIATRNGAPTNADANNSNQLYLTLYRSTAAGGPALGDQILWRTGSIYNPTMALWGLALLPVASYTGSGRITIGSEFIDTALDANGNPRLQHGAQSGMIYFGPDVASAYPVDFKNLWFYTNLAVPTTATFFQYYTGGGNPSGVGFYNNRVELGPAVTLANPNSGFRVIGTAVVDSNHFVNVNDFCILADTQSVAGPITISNNIFDNCLSDGIDFGGSGISLTRNFGFGWQPVVSNHQDPAQRTTASATQTMGEMAENIFVNDRGTLVQGGFFLSDQNVGFLAGVNIHNNICSSGGPHAINLDKPDAPVGKWNTVLTDPLVQPLNIVPGIIELTSAGQNGSTITGNVVNIASNVSTQTGVNTVDDCIIDLTGLTSAQVIAKYQIAFPNYPATNTDAKWKTRAGCLNIYTPANLAVASGGVKKADGTFYGYLFPDGSLNDGGVYTLGRLPVAT